MVNFYNIVGWINYIVGPIILLGFLIFALRNRKNFTNRYDESIKNQKESVQLLKEIRDLLKNKN